MVGPTTFWFFDHPSLFDKDLGMSLGPLGVLGIKIIACEACITFTQADMWRGTYNYHRRQYIRSNYFLILSPTCHVSLSRSNTCFTVNVYIYLVPF